MKNIKEVINIDNSNDQTATTVTEEKIIPELTLETSMAKETSVNAISEEETKELTDLPTETKEANAILPCGSPCPPMPNRTTNFCCIIDIPSNLNITAFDAARITYNLDCLQCVVEPCTTTATVCGCPITLTVFNVKIVGCIPFLINAFITSAACTRVRNDFPRDASLCCHDSVCVNNVICTRCSEAEANAACNIIREKLTNCTCVNATINPLRPLGCSNFPGVIKGIAVSGFFTLPNCNPSIPGNCNP